MGGTIRLLSLVLMLKDTVEGASPRAFFYTLPICDPALCTLISMLRGGSFPANFLHTSSQFMEYCSAEVERAAIHNIR